MDTLLVVLYKQTVQSSDTVKSFLKNCVNEAKNINLVIWDNSPGDSETSLQIGDNIFDYYHTPENLSLAVIYNKVIEKYNDSRVVYIFDQDSLITSDYFTKMNTAINSFPLINLFAPRIFHNKTLLSPSRDVYNISSVINSIAPGIHNSAGMRLIMSGIALRPQIINRVRFDENLRLYWIDNKFCFDYSRCFKQFYLIDYNLVHDLSIFKRENIRTMFRRMWLNVSGALYTAKKRGIFTFLINIVYLSVYSIKRIVRILALQFKL